MGREEKEAEIEEVKGKRERKVKSHRKAKERRRENEGAKIGKKERRKKCVGNGEIGGRGRQGVGGRGRGRRRSRQEA